jgi:hypothetical protein
VGIFLTQYVQALTTDMVFHAQYSSILIFLLAGVLFQRTPDETGGGLPPNRSGVKPQVPPP